MDYLQLDPGIRPFVQHLRDHGIDTIASCQGGHLHSAEWPWIAFQGGRTAGGRALRLITQIGHQTWRLEMVWSVQLGEMVSPPNWVINLAPIPCGRCRMCEVDR